MISWSCTYL